MTKQEWRMVPEVVRSAPERITIQVSDEPEDIDNKFPSPITDEMTWSIGKCVAVEVEYVRADIAAPTPPKSEQGWPDWTPRSFDNYEHDKRFAEESPSVPCDRNAVIEECLQCYSPDDSATDWADKIRRLKL